MGCAFQANAADSAQEKWEYARDRFEQRRCWCLAASSLDACFVVAWPGLRTLVKVEASRCVAGKTTHEVRYYLSDEAGENPRYYSKLARGHWGTGASKTTCTGIWT